MKTLLRNIQTKLLSDNWYILKKYTYEFLRKSGEWEPQTREVYDRGNGVTILLYNPEKKSILLTRQFRLPSYLNGNPTGLLLEACAGLIEDESPEESIKREALEETGHEIKRVEKIFSAYMSPGAVTEIIYFYTGQYSDQTKKTCGGGLDHEQEDIEVVELSLAEALKMIKTGEIQDAKTIMLLQYAQLHSLMD